ncbi:proteasome subunit beta type-4 [Scaptodrosophila lebanonensis]|uniref:Proteasome subunit beta n=1 Tax=Drosophila lebanonensis TaxID=7225 RepID=A0A6J2TFC9_DROLE|nr:proteasome subunit beta type-4 [Scaptodrosophila lebanonensis]
MFNNGIVQPLWYNGPSPGQFYNFPGYANNGNMKQCHETNNSDSTRSTAMITTGSSVLGIKFDQGVLIAADTLVSYGSLSRFQNIDRIFKINDNIIMGGGGDFADIQSIMRSIDQKMIEDQCYADNIAMRPKALATWMTRVLYNRRSRMNPLFIDVVIGGIDENNEPYLANVDLRGRAFSDYVVSTGFARHLALPLVREKKPADRDFTLEEASELIRQCMEVLYYRDTKNSSQYTVGVCKVKDSTSNQCDVEGPFQVDEKWSFAKMVKGY